MFESLKRYRVTERELKDWLCQQGWMGRAAEVVELELHAIQRPGWRQLFRFEVHLQRSDGEVRHAWGTLLSDQRAGLPRIEFCENADHRRDRLSELSEGMIVRRPPRKR